jgi:hypothetical protein
MRKGFILSDEEKERRKTCLEENRKTTLQRVSISECTNSSSTTQFESLSSTTDEIDRVSFISVQNL